MVQINEKMVKKILIESKIQIPQDQIIDTPDDAIKFIKKIKRPCIIKAQSIAFERLKSIPVRNATEAVDVVRSLQESQPEPKSIIIYIQEDFPRIREFVLGFSIDALHAIPIIYFSSDKDLLSKHGWQKERDGITFLEVDILRGVRDYQARSLCLRVNIEPDLANRIATVVQRFYQICRRYDIIRGEISPLALTDDRQLVALNSELHIDKAALFRYQAIKEEVYLDSPFSTRRSTNQSENIILQYNNKTQDWGELLPWIENQEDSDHLLPIFLLAINDESAARFIKETLKKEGVIVNHLCLMKGDISASMVFRIFQHFINSKSLRGFLVSGLGFSPIDQATIARGLLKAFRKNNLSIPGIIKFDAMNEENAIETVRDNCWDLPAIVEPYGHDNSINFCIKRLRLLIDEMKVKKITVDPLGNRESVAKPYIIDTNTGRMIIDHAKCEQCRSKICISSCPISILKDDQEGHAVLAIEAEKVWKGACIECLACEFFCWSQAMNAIDFQLKALELSDAEVKQ